MPSIPERIAEIVRADGFAALGKRTSGYLYRNTVRRILPRSEPIHYAGIQTSMYRKWGDLVVPDFLLHFGTKDRTDYEEALIRGLQSEVRHGDRVVVVGGGEGITVVAAANGVGEAGSVVCFEGGEKYARKVQITAEINGVSPRVSVRFAIVAEDVRVYPDSKKKAPTIISPSDLPLCDVLELDCEGAEIQILKYMTIRPRAIIVETHGIYGAPTDAVRGLLEARNYEVYDLGWAEASSVGQNDPRDIRVLVGRQRLGAVGVA